MRRHPRHGGSSAVFSYESSKDSNSLTATCRESHLKGQENQRWPTHHEQQLVVATRGLCGSKWDKGSVVQQAFDLLEGAFCLPKLARPLDEQLQRRGDCEARGCLVEPVLWVSPPFDKHIPPDRQGLMKGAKILPGLCVLGGILRDDVNIPRERVGLAREERISPPASARIFVTMFIAPQIQSLPQSATAQVLSKQHTATGTLALESRARRPTGPLGPPPRNQDVGARPQCPQPRVGP